MTISWKEVTGHTTEAEAKAEVVLMYVEMERSLRQVQRQLGHRVTERSIARMLQREGVTLRPRGGRNYVKDMHISEEEYLNLTYKELCEKYGISTATVRRLTQHYKSKPRLGRLPAKHGDEPINEFKGLRR